jgi:hypothetical protein
MNFEDEEYVRVYCKDTITIQKIGWEGRLVLWELLRKVDTTGILDFDRNDDLVEAIATLVRVPEEIVRVGLERLASRGVTVRHESSLEIVKFVEAQTAKRSDRLRAQEYRDRKRTGSTEQRDDSSRNVDKPNDSSRHVTDSHDSSLPALPCPASPCPALPRPAEEARERAEPPAPAPVVRGLVPVRPRAPTNPADALAVPIAERARLVLEDPGNGAWSSPQTWPEVVAVAEALARSAGHVRPKLGDCRRDVGVKTVLGHLADGWAPEELATLAGAIGRSKWWRDGGGTRGLSSLTAEVLRRAQNERPPRVNADPEIARELAKSARMRAEYAEEQANERKREIAAKPPDVRSILAQIGNGGQ